MNISKENNLFLTDLTDEGYLDDVVFVPADPLPMYQLRIRYTTENKDLNLNFAASKTLLDIKNDIHAVLKVPVRYQNWTGWPAESTNATKLSETGISAIHSLQLTRIDSDTNYNRDV